MSEGWWFQHDSERVVWRGAPRLSAAFPGVGLGVLVCAVAVASAVTVDSRLLAAVPVGGGLAVWSVLAVRRTTFVLTTRALWARKGVLGRRVRRVNTWKIQNTAFTQSLTGSAFGYGTVSVEVAGGDNLELRRVDDPETVQTRIRDEMAGADGTIPGSSDQWESVLELARAIRVSVADRGPVPEGNDAS